MVIDNTPVNHGEVSLEDAVDTEVAAVVLPGPEMAD